MRNAQKKEYELIQNDVTTTCHQTRCTDQTDAANCRFTVKGKNIPGIHIVVAMCCAIEGGRIRVSKDSSRNEHLCLCSSKQRVGPFNSKA